MKKIVVVGSANLDLVYGVDHLPAPGETILALDFATHPGGKGANQAVAAARLGANVSFCGSFGSDGNGEFLWKGMESEGIDLSTSTRADCANGNAAIFVDQQGRNQIVVAPNANAMLKPAQVKAALESASPDLVVAQLEVPLDAVMEAAQASVFLLNPAPAQPLPDELIARCTFIVPNETETEIITGISPTPENRSAAADWFISRGAKNVVLTLGSEGCYWKSAGGEEMSISAEPVTAVDTTAAGDAFVGALAHFWTAGYSIPEALAWANRVAGRSVSKAGAQPSLPKISDFS